MRHRWPHAGRGCVDGDCWRGRSTWPDAAQPRVLSSPSSADAPLRHANIVSQHSTTAISVDPKVDEELIIMISLMPRAPGPDGL